MIRRCKRALKGLVASSSGWRASAPLRRNACTVLTYHRIGPSTHGFPHLDLDVFRSQMRWLRANCEPIGPEQLEAAANGRRRRPHVLVTFDDGYRDFYDHAMPILDELRIPAVNFLSTAFVDGRQLFWWDVVHMAVHASRRRYVTLPWAASTIDVERMGRERLIRACKSYLVELPPEPLDEQLSRLVGALGADSESLVAERQIMTWAEVRRASGLATFGGHTHTHVRVTRATDDRVASEIETCKARLQAELGRTPQMFAYPIGDYTPFAKDVLSRLGFRMAFTTYDGDADRCRDWLAIGRISSPGSVGELAWRLASFSRREA